MVAVACGMNFTVAVSGRLQLSSRRGIAFDILVDKGEVFTFGKGRTSCLGHADRKTQNQPALVESLAGVNVKRYVVDSWLDYGSYYCVVLHVGIGMLELLPSATQLWIEIFRCVNEAELNKT